MANPVIVSDLEARFRSLTADEEGVAQALLDDAWAVLLMTIPDLEDRIAAGSVSTEAVTFVVAAMVLRVLRNPTGVRSWTLGDYSETRDGSLSSGGLYASTDEIRLLTGHASVARRGAFSVAPPEAESAACWSSSASDADLLHYLRYGTCP